MMHESFPQSEVFYKKVKRYQIAAKYTDLDEESSLHVAKECLISFRFEGRFKYHGNPWGVVEVVGAYTD